MKLKESKVSEYIKEVSGKIGLHRFPLEFIDEEIGATNSLLSLTHNSNPELNSIFIILYNKSKINSNETHIDICEEYCYKSKNPKETINFFATLFSLYEIINWLNKRKQEFKRVPEVIDEKSKKELVIKEEEFNESLEGEFTLTRKIIALEFLLKAAGENIKFGQKGVNKTKIAEFIDFLISKDSNPRDMRNSKLYRRLKYIWGNNDKVTLDNLNYVKSFFDKIELTNVSNDIEKAIIAKSEKTN